MSATHDYTTEDRPSRGIQAGIDEREIEWSVARAATRTLGMLGLQYLLGIAENLIGLPSETTGATNTASLVILVAHIVVAFGLVVGAARIAWMARGAEPGFRRLTTIALVVVVATFIAGGLTTGAEATMAVWSFAMAVGFVVAAGLYVAIVVQGMTETSEIR